MTRRACRVTQDEVRRMIRAVQSCGLSVGEVKFDGEQVRVVIGGDSGEDAEKALVKEPEGHL